MQPTQKSEEHKRKISEAMRGRKLTEEHRRNLSASHKGNKHSEETKLKMSEVRKLKCGPAAPAWKGDEVGYRGLHSWVSENKERTGVCSHCHTPGYTENANISGDYLRDVDDYIELCRRCHGVFDAR